jgi:putative membrane protein
MGKELGEAPLIDYNREAWWSTCFSWHGTVLPYILLRVGLLTGFCLLLWLLSKALPQGKEFPGLDPQAHTIMGLAISFIIGFRTNSSNSRYWEARSHWGMILNTCRNLVRMATVYAPPAQDFAKLVSAYVLLLKEQLRNSNDLTPIRNLLTGRELERLANASNPAQMLAGSLSAWIAERMQKGQIDSITANRMEGLVGVLVDNQGGCEKIRRTPLPFVYAALIKQTLFLFLITLPFVLIAKMGPMAPLAVMCVSIVMLGIEEAGVEIEDPFGLDANHLNLDQICATIGRDVADLAVDSRRG